MHYPDLQPCDYFGEQFAPKIKAIGWLESGQAYGTGELIEGFSQALIELLNSAWMPFRFRGFHCCDLCRLTSIPPVFRTLDGDEIPMGCDNLFVPGDGFLYASPSLMLHYIDAHAYAPPREYQEAVIACPKMRSMDYLKSILSNAPTGFAKHAPRKSL